MAVDSAFVKPPVGFRFRPSAVQLLELFLRRRVEGGERLDAGLIPQVDLLSHEPWDLPSLSSLPQDEGNWYYFCRRQVAGKPARTTSKGYWRQAGRDKEIFQREGQQVGWRKTLVFYQGTSRKGQKTSWVVHEYRLPKPESPHFDNVIYHLFFKGGSDEASPLDSIQTRLSAVEEVEQDSRGPSPKEVSWNEVDEPVQATATSCLSSAYQQAREQTSEAGLEAVPSNPDHIGSAAPAETQCNDIATASGEETQAVETEAAKAASWLDNIEIPLLDLDWLDPLPCLPETADVLELLQDQLLIPECL